MGDGATGERPNAQGGVGFRDPDKLRDDVRQVRTGVTRPGRCKPAGFRDAFWLFRAAVPRRRELRLHDGGLAAVALERIVVLHVFTRFAGLHGDSAERAMADERGGAARCHASFMRERRWAALIQIKPIPLAPVPSVVYGI